jgi:hypothetical protein
MHARQQLAGIRHSSTLGQEILLGGATLGVIAAIVGLVSRSTS